MTQEVFDYIEVQIDKISFLFFHIFLIIYSK